MLGTALASRCRKMVPLPSTLLTRAAVGASSRDRGYGSSAISRQRRPFITYGKKDTRPLPLTANHFRRSDYSIPPDECEDEDLRDRSVYAATRIGTRVLTQAAADESSNSGLSDEPDQPRPEEVEVAQPLIHCHSAGATAARPFKLSSTGTKQTDSSYSVGMPESKPAPVADVSSPAPKRVKRSAPGLAPAVQATNAPRRPPVNELVLVIYPLDNANFGHPQSSGNDIQTLDPINDHTGSAPELVMDPAGQLDVQSFTKKQPLSTYKNRLARNKSRYKSVRDLRKMRTGQPSREQHHKQSHGDGFTIEELHVRPLVRRALCRKRSWPDLPLAGFRALQLQSGPLPDVRFEQQPSTLELSSKYELCQPAEQASASQHTTKQVVFSDQARTETIIAQLSSISAPPAPRPVSDDEGSDNDDDDDDENEGEGEDCETNTETESDEDQLLDGLQTIADDEDYQADTEDVGMQVDEEYAHMSDYASGRKPPSEAPTATEGVTIDFRRLVPGHRPRRQINQDIFMEVTEKIVEVPDTNHLFVKLA